MSLRSSVGDSDRVSVGETDSSIRESSPDATGPSASTTAVGTFLLVAGGTAALAYAVTRFVESSDEDAAVDAPLETVRSRTAAVVPDEVGDRVSEAVPAEVGDRVAETVPDEVGNRVAETVPDEVGDRVSDAVPAESQSIPIGDRDSDADETEADTGSESEGSGADDDSESADAPSDVGDVGEPIDEEDVNADLADEPSSTKISSGSSDEIQDKPAEPGEMAVEDDVEELVDEAEDEVSGDESDVDEE